MLLPRFMCPASHPIFPKQPLLPAKASIARSRHRNSTRWFARRITTDEHKFFIRHRHAKTRGARPIERRSCDEPYSRTRAGDSKYSRAASTVARVKIAIAAPENHRGVQTQIAFRWFDSQRSLSGG